MNRRYTVCSFFLPALWVPLLDCGAAPTTFPRPYPMAAQTTDTSPDVETFCIGRFLIDMPAGSRISGAAYKYNFAKIERPYATTREKFDQDLQEREQMLRATPHRSEPSLLQDTQRPAAGTQVLAFFEEPYFVEGVNIEGRKWVDGTGFLLKAEADADKQSKAVARMTDRLSRLRPRADTDIPTDPGYCFGGGFIANPEWENEEARVNFRIAGHPDAHLSVWILPLAAHRRDKPLLDRVGGALGALGNLAASVHVLRRGDRPIGPFQEGAVTIGPFNGQEYLVTGPNSGGLRAHSFVWETQGEGTLQEPSVEIQMQTGNRDDKGNPQQTRLTDEQALRIWDGIVESFRLRPTRPAAVKTSDATPPLVPIGDLAATGRPCPQAGWWECVELSAPVQGGRRQHFALGERLPAAILLGEQSVWQKLKREQPQHAIATVWKFVGTDDPARSPRAPLAPDERADPA